jgi:hypothetical protein
MTDDELGIIEERAHDDLFLARAGEMAYPIYRSDIMLLLDEIRRLKYLVPKKLKERNDRSRI